MRLLGFVSDLHDAAAVAGLHAAGVIADEEPHGHTGNTLKECILQWNWPVMLLQELSCASFILEVPPFGRSS